MAITPIEIATMIPKSQEASLLKHNEQMRGQNQQLDLSSKFNQNIKQNSMQTVKASESEYMEYRYDAKDKGNNKYEQDKQKRKKKEEEKKQENTVRNGHFDIRI